MRCSLCGKNKVINQHLYRLTKWSCLPNEILSTLLALWKYQYLYRRRRGAVELGCAAGWNIQDSRRDEWPLLGAFNQWLAQCSQSPAPPGERLMGTGYFIRPSTSLHRIWGCNCVCFHCCFVSQADKDEPGWSGLGNATRGAIRSGRTRSRKGKRVKRAWRSVYYTKEELNWIWHTCHTPFLDVYLIERVKPAL